MLAVLRQRNFALLWSAGLVSMMGSWVLITALPFYVYEQTGSIPASGALWIAYVLPGLLLGSFAGVFVDRWDRKRTMIAANFARAALLLLLLLVRSPQWLWLVYVVAFLESAISQFFGPAENALLPRLVGEEHLITANSLNALNDNLARILGPAVGGTLIGTLGLGSIVLIDSASYLIAGLVIMLIAAPAGTQETAAAPDPSGGGVARVWHEWLEGLRIVKRERVVTAIFMVAGVAMLADNILTALLVPFVDDVLQAGALGFGWFLTARGVGGLVGGLLMGQASKRMQPAQMLPVSLVGVGLCCFGIYNFPVLASGLVLIALAGVVVVGWLASQQTLLQLSVQDQLRGRVFGLFGTILALTSLLGLALASALGDMLGLIATLNLGAALYSLAGVIAYVLLRTVKAPVEQAQEAASETLAGSGP